MNTWSEIIAFVLKLVESVSTTIKNFRDSFKEAPNGSSDNKKIKPIVLCGITFLVFLSVGYWIYSSYSKPLTADNYPPVSIVDTPNENNEIIFDSTSNNTIVFDVEFFYDKYYEDGLTSSYNLLFSDVSLSNAITDFITFNSIEFGEN